MKLISKAELLWKISTAKSVDFCLGTKCRKAEKTTAISVVEQSTLNAFLYIGDLDGVFEFGITAIGYNLNNIVVESSNQKMDYISHQGTKSETITAGSEDYYLIDAFEARAKKESENYKKRVNRLRKTYDLVWFANNFFLLLSIGILWGSWYFDNKPLKYIFPSVVLVLIVTNITAVPSLLEWTDKKIASLPRPKNTNQLLTAHKKEMERIKNEL